MKIISPFLLNVQKETSKKDPSKSYIKLAFVPLGDTQLIMTYFGTLSYEDLKKYEMQTVPAIIISLTQKGYSFDGVVKDVILK